MLAALGATGCARAARDTTGFAVQKETTVKAPFEQTWQTVKSVLRDQGYNIYTRDKRGSFVAYTDMHRFLLVQPRRIKYTVEVKPVDADQTSISVQAVRQVYGVTLLTYPDWHDRKMKDESAPAKLVEAVQAKIAGGDAAKPAAKDAK
jgi:hypothetical protein